MVTATRSGSDILGRKRAPGDEFVKRDLPVVVDVCLANDTLNQKLLSVPIKVRSVRMKSLPVRKHFWS